MALDEALLASAATAGQGTVRLYSWREPTISLGYFQPLASRAEHPPSKACAIVRRASGGGAIVHDRELTYSFAMPVAERKFPGANEWYVIAHEAWIGVLADLGLAAERHVAADRPPPSDEPFLCYQRRATGDVVAGEHKIVGSAQRRHQGALLQHGSVIIARSPRAPELSGIADLIPRSVEYDDLADRWLHHLAKRLDGSFDPGQATDDELAVATRLQAEKFGHPSWLEKR